MYVREISTVLYKFSVRSKREYLRKVIQNILVCIKWMATRRRRRAGTVCVRRRKKKAVTVPKFEFAFYLSNATKIITLACQIFTEQTLFYCTLNFTFYWNGIYVSEEEDADTSMVIGCNVLR